jgi:hypothetical protein
MSQSCIWSFVRQLPENDVECVCADVCAEADRATTPQRMSHMWIESSQPPGSSMFASPGRNSTEKTRFVCARSSTTAVCVAML